MLFVRWQIPEQRRLVASRCNSCDRMVGCSSRTDCLDVAERAHAACSHPKAPASALNLNKADALLFSLLEPILRSR